MPINKIVKKSKEDKFYTNPVIASSCLQLILEELKSVDFVLEPSSGDGAFSKNPSLSLVNCIEYDLSPPKGSNAIQGDFLSVQRDQLPEGSFGIIGNPPFGERNNLSKAFIKNCISFGDDVKFIAFILPEVYSKFTLQKAFPTEWKLSKEVVLPKDSFLLDGKPYHVPCVWQVWAKGGDVDIRELPPRKESSLFKISTKNHDSDFFIFGASPSKIINVEDVKDTNRGYYFKSYVDKWELKQVISEIDWRAKGKSSVNGGVSWFTLGEVINHTEEKYYEKYPRVSED